MNLSALLKKIGALFMAIVSFVSLIGYLNSEESYDVSGNILYGGTGYDINAAPLKQRSTSTAADFYVSPTGSDSNDGKTAATAFATPAKARDAVRALKASLGAPRDIVVLLRGGTYHIQETLIFTSADSGMDRYAVTYRNYPGETPVFDAGTALTGWQPFRDGIYRTAYTGPAFRVLSENGKVGTIARTPNKGDYFRVSEKQIKFSHHAEQNNSFVYDEKALFASLSTSNTVEVFAFPGGVGGDWNWFSGYYPVTSTDTETSTVYFTREPNTCVYVFGGGSRFFVLNDLSLLDEEGEFFCDTANGYVYYKPHNAANLTNGTISAALLKNAVRFEGGSHRNRVENIVLEGLSVRDSDTKRNGNSGLIEMTNSRNITVRDCRLSGAGCHGLFAYGYNEGITVTGCVIGECGHTGVQIEGVPFYRSSYGHAITNNLVYETGLSVGHGAGVQIMATDSSRIAHNRIDGTPRYAASIKGQRPEAGTRVWLNGPDAPSVTVTQGTEDEHMQSYANIIEYNDITNAMYDTQDGGTIEMWSSGLYNIVRNNVIHDCVARLTSYGFGIYIDDFNPSTTVTGNLIYNMTHMVNTDRKRQATIEGIIYMKHVNGVCTNNIIAFCQSKNAVTFADYGDDQPVLNSTARNNIVYECKDTNSAAELFGFLPLPGLHYPYYAKYVSVTTNNGKFKEALAFSDENLYFNTKAETQYFTALTDLSVRRHVFRLSKIHNAGLLRMRLNGYEKNSLIADPLFTDAANYDFSFTAQSPAHAIGIAPLDYGKAGLTDEFIFVGIDG